jgi:hypothetical protein
MTTADGRPEDEPVAPTEPAEEVPSESSKSSVGRTTWSLLSWTIKEEDIKSVKDFKLVSKMLLGEINRLMEEVRRLTMLTVDYNQKCMDLAVREERLRGLQESVTVRALLFSLGGLAGGLIFLPDLAHYQWAITALCFACFLLAIWNPDWLNLKKK